MTELWAARHGRREECSGPFVCRYERYPGYISWETEQDEWCAWYAPFSAYDNDIGIIKPVSISF